MEETVLKLSCPQAGENASPLVTAALEKLKNVPNPCLLFEKGTYHFYEEGTVRRFYADSCCYAGVKKIVFPLFDFDGLTVDGGGAVFVFHGLIQPFLILGCRNLTLRNFIFDRALSPAVRFTVRKNGSTGFRLVFDRKNNPCAVKDGNVIFRREWGDFSTRSSKISLHKIEYFQVQYLFAGDTEASSVNLPAPYMLTDAYDAEDGVDFVYRDDSPSTCNFRDGDALFALLDGGRSVTMIAACDSDSLRIGHINVRRGFGMGVAAQFCHDIEIDGFSTDPSYYGENVTMTADAMHLIHCTGLLDIHDCHISDILDDAINVHGIYTVVEQVQEDGILAAFGHQDHDFVAPCRPGDRLVIIDRETREEKAEFLVSESVFRGENGGHVFLRGTFLSGKEDIRPGFLIENPDRMPVLHYHDNVLYDYPNIRLSGGGTMLVERNRMEHAGSALLALDLAEYWYESGRIRHLIFRNNVMKDCNALGGNSFITVGVPGFDSASAPIIHDTVEISGNTFEGIREKAVTASGIRNLIFRDDPSMTGE